MNSRHRFPIRSEEAPTFDAVPGTSAWSWVAVGIAAVGLFLLTLNPLLASIVPYVWAGWHSFWSAIWLRRSDSRRARGKTMFWFYLATSGWKAATSAFAAVVAMIIAAELTNRDPGLQPFIAAMLVLLAGLGIATACGIIAVAAALRTNVRVFVIPDIQTLCGGDFSSISMAATRRRRFNYAVFVLAVSLIVPVILVAGVLVTVTLADDNPNDVALWPAIASLASLFVGPLAVIPVYAYCSKRIIARSPNECWPDEAELPAAQASFQSSSSHW